MKKTIIIISAMLLSAAYCFSQGTAINSTGSPADNSAMLDVNSTSKGALFPRMTLSQRNAIASPAYGLLIFNSDCNNINYNAGTPASPNWIDLNSPYYYIPVATTASGITTTQITANWNPASGAVGYYLDAATDTGFTGFVPGYNNLDVQNVTSYNITGLTCNMICYYRVRAYNNCGTSGNSNIISGTAQTCPLDLCGSYTYNEVTSNGKVWLDRNLGSSRVATSSTDYLAYGSLYQWGRLSDGHQCITWTSPTTATPAQGTTSTPSPSDIPPNPLYITGSDWRSPPNNNLWQGINGTNNPCPSSYRLPTESELNSERLSWSSQDPAGAYSSPLKLPVAMRRDDGGLIFTGPGSYGYYWSSTVNGSYARMLLFYSGYAGIGDNTRTWGYSVRCIKN